MDWRVCALPGVPAVSYTHLFQQCKGVKRRVLLHIVLHPFGKARGHINPDGDAVGSVMGVAYYLRENFPCKFREIIPYTAPGLAKGRCV